MIHLDLEEDEAIALLTAVNTRREYAVPEDLDNALDKLILAIPDPVGPKIDMEEDGQRIRCSKCENEVLLPYTDETRTRVHIAPLEGWLLMPAVCPLHNEEQ